MDESQTAQPVKPTMTEPAATAPVTEESVVVNAAPIAKPKNNKIVTLIVVGFLLLIVVVSLVVMLGLFKAA